MSHSSLMRVSSAPPRDAIWGPRNIVTAAPSSSTRGACTHRIPALALAAVARARAPTLQGSGFTVYGSSQVRTRRGWGASQAGQASPRGAPSQKGAPRGKPSGCQWQVT